MLIALDTETTGKDLYHSSKPFFVTFCTEEGEQFWYEAPVDPLTREPQWNKSDIEEIEELIACASVTEKVFVLQNSKFDSTALRTIGIRNWPWNRVHDTLIAGHLLASNQPHNLTDMVLHYVGEDIQSYEDRLEEATQKCRRLCRSHLKDWVIASKDLENMPSVKERTWKTDTWLPKTLCLWAQEQRENYIAQPPNPRARTPPPPPWWWDYSESNHPYLTVLEEYANTDSAMTMALWKVMERELKAKGYWKIYQRRMLLPDIAEGMEQYGITLNKSRLEESCQTYAEESYEAAKKCVSIAKGLGYDLILPKTGNNKSLIEFCFGASEEGDHVLFPKKTKYLDLPVVGRTEKGAPSLDRECLETYLDTLPKNSKQYYFIKALAEKRQRDTAISYMNGYKRFWLKHNGENINELDFQPDEWYVLHPNLNITGTDTLRWSSSNPNEQNCSKKKGFNLRYCFGPAPSREWWSFDAQNVELRIPAYFSGEKDLIYVFEHPDEPPYYGSYHFVVFDLLHSEEFKRYGKECKSIYKDTLYQWTKNGNFSVIYGAQKRKVDATYKVDDAYELVRYRFPKIAELADRQVKFAQKYGYVETIPDKTVDPTKGYPIMCSRGENGYVEPTKPLNYTIQSTAMWLTQEAMIKVENQLRKWRNERQFNAYMNIQVHDEIDCDFPKSSQHPKLDLEKEKSGKPYFRTSNLWRARILQRLMNSCGDQIGVPVPFGLTYHEKTWDEEFVC